MLTQSEITLSIHVISMIALVVLAFKSYRTSSDKRIVKLEGEVENITEGMKTLSRINGNTTAKVMLGLTQVKNINEKFDRELNPQHLKEEIISAVIKRVDEKLEGIAH